VADIFVTDAALAAASQHARAASTQVVFPAAAPQLAGAPDVAAAIDETLAVLDRVSAGLAAVAADAAADADAVARALGDTDRRLGAGASGAGG
jgi:hypothetical protein